MRFPKLLVLTAALAVVLAPAAAAQAPQAGDLPRRNFAIPSVRSIDLDTNVATLPLFRGTSGGTTVWYVVTDASDAAAARRLGVNFAGSRTCRRAARRACRTSPPRPAART